MSGVLVDTDVLVEYLRGDARAADHLEGEDRPLHVSVVTVAELFVGARPDEEATFRSFLEAFSVEPVDRRVAVEGGRYRREFGESHGTGLADALIAATASERSLALVTFNVRHFPTLEAERPYRR